MMLAGVPVRNQDVLELARLVRDAGFDDTAERLVVAFGGRTSNRGSHDSGSKGDSALPRRSIGLGELRGVLLTEHD
jgi:hypothetical protein